jgi:hypothetical protein
LCSVAAVVAAAVVAAARLAAGVGVIRATPSMVGRGPLACPFCMLAGELISVWMAVR